MPSKIAVVCDDDRLMVRIVEHMLQKLGFSVFGAAGGEEGLSLVKTHNPQLLILDLDMPGKDGMAVLRDMQAAASRPYTIIVSALESKDKHQEAMALGAREVFVKPFNPADLIQRVEALIGEGKL